MTRFTYQDISNNSIPGTIKRGGKLLPAKVLSVYCPVYHLIPKGGDVTKINK